MNSSFARRFTQTCATLCLLAVLAAAAHAQQTNDYLGVHTLFLSKFNATSRANLITVLTETNAPGKIQLICVPAFNSGGASSAAAWSNLDEVVRAVNNSGRVITVGVALSFHATSTGLSRSADTDTAVVYEAAVGKLAAFYQRHLTAITQNKLKVVIIPSLEDQLASTSRFINLTKVLVAKLRSELRTLGVSSIDTVIVRRSTVSVDRTGTAAELSRDCQKIAGTTGLRISCQSELHGPSRGGTVWSNDGIFSYADITQLTWTEAADSAANSESFKTTAKIPLTAFTASSAARSPVSVLWRPAYNLWPRTVTNGKVKYKKPSAIRSRSDNNADGNGAFFGAQEVRVLRYFLRNAPGR